MLTPEESKRLRAILEIGEELSDDEIEAACPDSFIDLIRFGIAVDEFKEMVKSEFISLVNRLSEIANGLDKIT